MSRELVGLRYVQLISGKKSLAVPAELRLFHTLGMPKARCSPRKKKVMSSSESEMASGFLFLESWKTF